MADTKSCRECVHDNPDDYEKYCHCCITNDKTNWEGEEPDCSDCDPMDI